jgi:hypothetical protein
MSLLEVYIKDLSSRHPELSEQEIKELATREIARQESAFDYFCESHDC